MALVHFISARESNKFQSDDYWLAMLLRPKWSGHSKDWMPEKLWQQMKRHMPIHDDAPEIRSASHLEPYGTLRGFPVQFGSGLSYVKGFLDDTPRRAKYYVHLAYSTCYAFQNMEQE